MNYNSVIDIRPHHWKVDMSCIFCKSRDEWGCFSNMSGGFPINDGTRKWSSSEALYQALRYPFHAGIQEEIRKASNGFEAKLIAKKYIEFTRDDWMTGVRLTAMMHVLTLKVEQNEQVMAELVRTEDKAIVEFSRKDPFWGAQPMDDAHGHYLYGANVLGQCWNLIRSGERQWAAPNRPTLDIFFN